MYHHTKCPLCQGNPPFSSLIECRDYLVSNGVFSLEKCPGCGFVFTNPRPDNNNLGDYYKSTDYISHSRRFRSISERIYHTVRNHMLNKKTGMLAPWTIRGNRVLDYGCGTGSFLKTLETAGYEAVGVEPEKTARDFALEGGLNVKTGLDEILRAYGADFHAITMWHVLEHLPDPMDTLKHFHSLLTDNGILVIAVPLYESYDGRYYREHWGAWDVPRHLYHFSRETINRLCAKASFELVAQHPLPYDSYYVSLLSEKHLNSLPGPLAAIRAMGIGFVSNFIAKQGYRPWSSEVFVYKRVSR